MITKEKDLPKPPLKEVKYKDLKPMMLDLDIDECLFYPCENKNIIKAVRTKYHNIRFKMKYKDKIHLEFSTRAYPDGLRIWRDK